MQLIARITDRDVGSGEPNIIDSVSRYAARGALLDHDNRAAMMYMSRLDLYKLPGGGIEAGESREAAFLREIKEETGFDAAILHELGCIEEHKGRNRFMQMSYCYAARSEGKNAAGTALSGKEKELGMETRWMPISEAIGHMTLAAQAHHDYSTRFMILRDRMILEEAARRLRL